MAEQVKTKVMQAWPPKFDPWNTQNRDVVVYIYNPSTSVERWSWRQENQPALRPASLEYRESLALETTSEGERS